ncbi:MAG: hypothetical protein OCD76_22110 [Reichenbachiella sp.]
MAKTIHVPAISIRVITKSIKIPAISTHDIAKTIGLKQSTNPMAAWAVYGENSKTCGPSLLKTIQKADNRAYIRMPLLSVSNASISSADLLGSYKRPGEGAFGY